MGDREDAIIRLTEAEMLRATIDSIISRSLGRGTPTGCSESEQQWMLYLNDLRSEVLKRQAGFYAESQGREVALLTPAKESLRGGLRTTPKPEQDSGRSV